MLTINSPAVQAAALKLSGCTAQQFDFLYQQSREGYILQALAALQAAEVGELVEALTKLLSVFPTDSDMDRAGWNPEEIDTACNAHTAAMWVRAKFTGG